MLRTIAYYHEIFNEKHHNLRMLTEDQQYWAFCWNISISFVSQLTDLQVKIRDVESSKGFYSSIGNPNHVEVTYEFKLMPISHSHIQQECKFQSNSNSRFYQKTESFVYFSSLLSLERISLVNWCDQIKIKQWSFLLLPNQ